MGAGASSSIAAPPSLASLHPDALGSMTNPFPSAAMGNKLAAIHQELKDEQEYIDAQRVTQTSMGDQPGAKERLAELDVEQAALDRRKAILEAEEVFEFSKVQWEYDRANMIELKEETEAAEKRYGADSKQVQDLKAALGGAVALTQKAGEDMRAAKDRVLEVRGIKVTKASTAAAAAATVTVPTLPTGTGACAGFVLIRSQDGKLRLKRRSGKFASEAVDLPAGCALSDVPTAPSCGLPKCKQDLRCRDTATCIRAIRSRRQKREGGQRRRGSSIRRRRSSTKK